MAALFTADIENRGLVLDPRTKLFVMITLVIFALGGTGSDISAVRYGTIAVSILPVLLLMTARQYKKATVFGILYALIKSAEIFLVPNITGAELSIIGLCCLIFVRLMPGLIMGAYMLSSTTVSEFIAAMHRMHIPQQITIPMSVMFRFFPTVLEEFTAINTAMKMRDIRIGGKNAGKLVEYRLVPLMVCSVNIGSELSAAALTRGLGTKVRRTNICKIGFHIQDIAVLLLILTLYIFWILGMFGVMK
ncbi:MAG: energy-coupling factor transporter transmembrane protein EcfT [Ruminococcus sp.]|uniref:energy-coupling factor transporter transmembrane component T n=1 Tax=Ruminococcus sp. TaxID=41978 RepID=UPI0025D016FD|nr:energy-coupling factor transporter transmembrane component T [Ruminococcus sp.]MCR5541231.1 energy-coupling factor transporter transmembrane protein EcfT [Ruminococcus sp.]